MKKVFGDKKFNLGLIVVLLILAVIIAFSFFMQNINKNVVVDDNSAASISQQEKEDNENSAENKAEKKEEVNKSDISKYLDEGETLEGLINDFNTLPEGDEKEKVREKLEKIFEEAQESSPAKAN